MYLVILSDLQRTCKDLARQSDRQMTSQNTALGYFLADVQMSQATAFASWTLATFLLIGGDYCG